MCCTLVLRTSPHIRFLVQSARVFASGFLSAPLTRIQLPSATLRRYLTGAGLARLIRTFPSITLPLYLTAFFELVRSRERTRKQPGLPGTQPAVSRAQTARHSLALHVALSDVGRTQHHFGKSPAYQNPYAPVEST